jgi:hypothetical protein
MGREERIDVLSRPVSHGFGDRQFQNRDFMSIVEFAEGLEGCEEPCPWKVFG